MPVLVYDDDCGFCKWSADYVRRNLRPDEDLEFVAFSELDDREDLRERLPDDYEDCAHYLTDDEVLSCGAAMEAAFLLTEQGEAEAGDLVRFLRNFDEYATLREDVYAWVADNRPLFGQFLSKEEVGE